MTPAAVDDCAEAAALRSACGSSRAWSGGQFVLERMSWAPGAEFHRCMGRRWPAGKP